MALQNDWIVAGINNPDFTVSDFANFADLTTENTQLLGVDDYIKTDFIQNHPYFQDDAGNFNEDLFRNYYAARAQEFDTFAQDEFYRGPALDMFDLDRTQETPVKDIGFNITRGFNPDRQRIGIEGVNVWSDPTLSQREIAKQNRVFNTEAGEFEDWTVNDHTLATNFTEWFKDLWRDPLVLATWDDDGVHVDPTTGLPQQHIKGQPKLNDKGTYYYETLGDRSVLGKDVLSVFDTLTVDGEGMNRYDFLDSNDLHKSVGGTVMKNLAMLLPTFIPYVGPIYSGYLVARELSKTLPMLSGMVTSLTGGETPLWAEKASAWAQRATPSDDDWSRQHPWAATHFISLVTDLALLTGQQKFIADALGAARGGQRYIEEATLNARRLFQSKALKYGAGDDVWRACLSRFMPQAEKMAVRSGQLGRDLGLAYMSLVFQHGVYDDMLQHGASKQEASAVALGAILGMFSVDKWLHLGEIFYDDATGNTVKVARRLIGEELDKVRPKFDKAWKLAEASGKGSPGKILTAIRSARDWASDNIGKYADQFRYHTLTATGKMIGSGVERVAETLVGDLSKGMYELAGQFGAPTTVKDVGSFENVWDRYGMAFMAGVVGAGVHYGGELLKRGSLQVPKLDESVETLVRNGYADELRTQIDRLEKRGRTGNTSLSAIHDVKNDKGERVGWETVKSDDPADFSQGRYVAESMRRYVDTVEAVLNDNGINLTDDEAFERAVMGERRLKALADLAPLTDFYDRLADSIDGVVKGTAQLRLAEQSVDGTPGGGELRDETMQRMLADYNSAESDEARAKTAWGQRAAKIDEQREKVERARRGIEDLFSGRGALRTARMVSFVSNPLLVDSFVDIPKTMDEYSKETFNKPVASLNDKEYNDFVGKWREYVNGQIKAQMVDAFDRYERYEKVVAPILLRDEAKDAEYAEWGSGIWGKLDELSDSGRIRIGDRLIPDGGRLPNESEEQWRAATTRAEGESEEDFVRRRAERMAVIQAYNDEVKRGITGEIEAELDKIGWRVDPMTLGMIRGFLESRNRPSDIIGSYASKYERRTDPLVLQQVRRIDRRVGNVGDLRAELEKEARDSERDRVVRDLEGCLRKMRGLKVTVPGVDGGEDSTVYLSKYLGGRTYTDAEGVEREANASMLTARQLLDILHGQAVSAAEEAGLDAEGVDVFEVAWGGTLLGGLTEESAMDVYSRLEDFVFGSGYGEAFDSAYDLDKVMGGLVRGNSGKFADSVVKPAVERAVERRLKDFDAIAKEVGRDPYLSFLKRLETDVRNPVREKIDALAEAEGVKIPQKVSELMQSIWDDYDSLEDVSQFVMDEALENVVKDKIRPLLRRLRTFIGAASSTPDDISPFGQNRWYNEFIEAHRDSLPPDVGRLPEIRDDLVQLYMTVIGNTEAELGRWLRLSDEMQTDKENRIMAMDAAIARMNYATLCGIAPGTKTIEGNEYGDGWIEWNGKAYNLREGFSEADETDLRTDRGMMADMVVESAFYRNVGRVAKDAGVSVVDLMCDPLFVGKLGIDLDDVEVLNQRNVSIVEGMDERATEYAKLMYVATVLSERPEDWYAYLKRRITDNNGKAPIGSQEVGLRMIRAMMRDGNLSRIVASLYPSMGLPLELMDRFVIGTGGAGVGKTTIFAASFVRMLDEFGYKGEVALLGPNADVTHKLVETVRREKVEREMREYTIDDFLREHVKDYDSIMKVIGDRKSADPKAPENKWFTRHAGTGGRVYYTLNRENVEFINVADKDRPATVLLDETTNLDTVQGALLNAYMREIGRYGVLTGDFRQITVREPIGMGSVEDGAVYGIRSPELTLSIRNGNVQKVGNTQREAAVLDMMRNDSFLLTSDQFDANYMKYLKLIRAIRPAYYHDGADLNGSMVVPTLDDGIVEMFRKLSTSKREDGKPFTVAFIGDNGNNSAVYMKLRAAGVAIKDVDVRTIDTMKGSEFDYVIVDKQFNKDEEVIFKEIEGAAQRRSDHLMTLLRMHYTLDTRSVEGTLFVDPDGRWSELLGDGVKSERKAQARPLDEVIDRMRKRKEGLLGEMRLPESAKVKGGGKDKDGAEKGKDGKKEDEGKKIEDGKKVVDEKKGKEGEPVDVVSVDKTDPIVVSPKEYVMDPEERAERDEAEQEKTMKLEELDVTDDLAASGAAADPEIGEMLAAGGDGFVPPFDTGALTGDVRRYEHESYDFIVTSAGRWTGAEWQAEAARRDGVKVGAKDTDRYAWCIRHPEDGPLRNMQCLVGEDTVITSYSRKRELQRQLKRIKDSAKFSAVEYDDLPDELKRIVDRDGWRNRAIGLEFRLVDDDEMRPLHSHMDEIGMIPAGIRRRIFANYVLVFDGIDPADRTHSSRRTMVIDLSGLNNPDTLASHVADGSLKASYENAARVADERGDADLAGRMRECAEDIEEAAQGYAGHFAELLEAFQSEENDYRPMLFDVDGKVIRSMRTWIARSRDVPVRLDGEVDVKSVDKAMKGEEYDPEHKVVRHSFLMGNPDIVVSPVYVALTQNVDRLGLSPSVSNSAVVFVSDNTRLKESELCQTYIDQRTAYDEARARGEASAPPEVRMLLLRNIGLTIGQFRDMKLIDKLGIGTWSGKPGEEKGSAPFNQNYMGIGMFLSLWNSRAAIKEFNARLSDWIGGKYTEGPLAGRARNAGGSVEKALAVADAYDRWAVGRNGAAPESIREILDGMTGETRLLFDDAEVADEAAFQSVLEDLRAFNDVTLKDLPFFRLGSYWDVKGRGYGFHVQRSTSVNEEWYGKGEANMCYLTPGCAERFEVMLDAFLGPLVDDGGLFGLRREVPVAGGEPDWRPFGEREFVDLKRDVDLNSVYKLPTQIDKSDDGRVGGVKYRNNNYFTLMTKMVRRVLNKALALDDAVSKGKPVGERGEKVPFNGLIRSDGGPKDGYITFDMEPLMRSESGEGGSFIDMLSLLFHGTVEDIHRWYGAEDPDPDTGKAGAVKAKGLVQMDGVRFPNGFYIEPGIDTKASYKYSYDGPDGSDAFIHFRETTTSGAFFYVQGFVRGAGIRLENGDFMAVVPEDAVTYEGLLAAKRARNAEHGVETKGGDWYDSGEVSDDTVDYAPEPAETPEPVRVRQWLTETENALHGPGGFTVEKVTDYVRGYMRDANVIASDPDGLGVVADRIEGDMEGAGYYMDRPDGLEGVDAASLSADGFEVVSMRADDTLPAGSGRVEDAVEVSRSGVKIGKTLVTLVVGPDFKGLGGGASETPETPETPGTPEMKPSALNGCYVTGAATDAPARRWGVEPGETVAERIVRLIKSEGDNLTEDYKAVLNAFVEAEDDDAFHLARREFNDRKWRDTNSLLYSADRDLYDFLAKKPIC